MTTTTIESAPKAICNICYKPEDRPFRVLNEDRSIRFVCVAKIHDEHIVRPSAHAKIVREFGKGRLPGREF